MLEEEGLIQSRAGAKSCVIVTEQKLLEIRTELLEEDAKNAISSLKLMGVSREEAQNQVGELAVESHRLAIIPTAGKHEILCHEFVCSAENGSEYIIYVNTETGGQICPPVRLCFLIMPWE